MAAFVPRTGNARGARDYEAIVGTVPHNHGEVHKFFNAHLTDDGTETGEHNVLGNYTIVGGTTEVTQFYYLATEDTRVQRMVIEIEDTAGMGVTDYGNITSGLTAGVHVHHIDIDGTTKLHDLTLLDPIKTNGQWGSYCYDVKINTWGNGNDNCLVRWTFSNAGTPIRLKKGQRFAITVADDLTGLTAHRFHIQGYRENSFE